MQHGLDDSRLLCRLDEHAFAYPGETWQQALERFPRLCHVDLLEWDSPDDKVVVNLDEIHDSGALYELAPPHVESEIAGYERQHNLTVPATLRQLLVKTGMSVIYAAHHAAFIF